ncbi:MAG: imidazolonepropionase-like amidohydrolase, partial [Pseudohongiellaceae bacterium]
VSDRLGSLEVGKDADFALYSGHPFDTLSRVEQTFVDGELMFERRSDVYADWSAEMETRIAAGRAALADLPEFPEAAVIASRNQSVQAAAVNDLAARPSGTRTASTPSRPAPSPVALVGARVHTMEFDEDGDAVVHDQGTVLLRDGLIEEVLPSRGDAAQLTAAGYTVRDVSGFDVWPGWIDGGTTVGLGEISMVEQSMDVNEVGGDQPDIRASMGWHPDSETIPVARANGITSALIEPGGGSVRGQSALFGLEGWTVSEALIAEGTALHLGTPRTHRDEDRVESGASEQRDVDHLCLSGGPDHSAAHNHAELTAGRPDADKLAERIEDAWSDLAQMFADAREYARWSAAAAMDGSSGPQFDPRLDALGPYALGQSPVIFHANTADQIADALDFADTHSLKAVISGGREAWKVADRLALADVGVLVGPVLSMPMGNSATYDGPYSNAGLLHRAGVRIGFRSGDAHSARDLPYHAAMAVAFGLDHDAALAALTRGTAEILGLGDRLGRIAPGLRADLLITAGDPLQIVTPIEDVIIGGRVVGTDSKHTRLYERYRQRLHDPASINGR